MRGIFFKLHSPSLLPIEVIALISMLAAAIISLAFSQDLYWPNGESAQFAANHYLGPIIPALAVIALPFIGRKREYSHSSISRALRVILAFVVVVFLHFNFKLWAQLVNPVRFDLNYQHIDILFPQVIMACESVRTAFLNWLPFEMVHAYHDLFVAMFILSFLVHAALGQTEVANRLVTSVAAVLVLGGVAYMAAPAWGPFVYSQGVDPAATGIQRDMARFQAGLIDSAGSLYYGSQFTAALAAMPSLHAAHSAVFLYFAARHAPLLGVFYVPIFVFLCADAVASKWHYLVDIPAGLAVAAISIWFAYHLHRNHQVTRLKNAGHNLLQIAAKRHESIP